MIRYVLDSDHISLFLGGYVEVQERVRREILATAVSIVSVQEVFNGWVSLLNRSESEAQRVRAYTKLNSALTFFKSMQVVNYDESASQVYHQLIQSNPVLAKRRLEKDVRIASIALANGATIVTRNRRDFELVPGLNIEDWSI
jgi:tRNA(fMet)-specific endonuclease VapC